MTTYEITKVEVLHIEAVGPVVKDSDGKGFSAPIVYVLADGQRVETSFGSTRKKDVLPGIEKDNARAEGGNITANFENGRFYGTTTTFRLYTPPTDD